MNNPGFPYRSYGVDICGELHDVSQHRTEDAAKKAAAKLQRAYDRQLYQISARYGYITESGKIRRITEDW
jgi:hypothetical protein